MKQVRTAPAGFCSQHHRPRAECDPDSRDVQSLRTSDSRIRKVEARAASLGMDRNAGLEAAIDEWTDGVDEDALPPLAELLAELRALREQVSQLTPPDAPGTSSGPLAPPSRTRLPPPLKFRSTDPGYSPDVIPYPVPEPADHGTKKGRRG